MAISVDLFILWIVTWFSYRFQMVLDGLCVRLSSLVTWLASIYDTTRYGSVEVSGNPHNVPCSGSCICWCLYIICCLLMTLLLNVIHPFYQSMVGLYHLIHGILRITPSLPRAVIYHLVGSCCPLILKCPLTWWVIVPFLFILLSTFWKVRGLGSHTVGSWYLSTTQVFIMATLAPVLMRLLTPTALPLTSI